MVSITQTDKHLRQASCVRRLFRSELNLEIKNKIGRDYSIHFPLMQLNFREKLILKSS